MGADAFGLPLTDVTARIGDSTLPASPVEGGSWTAASNGSAVQAACEAVRKTLFKHAKKMANSPLANSDLEEVEFGEGRIFRADDPARGLAITEVMHASDLTEIEEKGKVGPNLLQMMKYISYTHSAVRRSSRGRGSWRPAGDENRLRRRRGAEFSNPKTARSQILGGVVMGIGMALHEGAMTDHRLGKIMNSNLGEYHIPAHADIEDIEVIFVDEHDEKVSPLGVKGLGEIGIVGIRRLRWRMRSFTPPANGSGIFLSR